MPAASAHIPEQALHGSLLFIFRHYIQKERKGVGPLGAGQIAVFGKQGGVYCRLGFARSFFI